jgi:hypothetical protein
MEGKFTALDMINTTVAVVGVAGALFGGTIAYLDYRGRAKLQALSELHAAQLATCPEIAAATAHLYSADNLIDFRNALGTFSELKHGHALDLLAPAVLDKMVDVYNLSLGIKSNKTGAEFKNDVDSKICNAGFEVVIACRSMLAAGYKAEGGIEEIATDYTMGWALPDACISAPTSERK